MKNIYLSLLLLFCYGTSCMLAAQKYPDKIVILHTNDTHSQIEPLPPSDKKAPDMGGVVRRKALIDSVRQAEKNVLLVDAGDVLQGTPYFTIYKGEVEMMTMNRMGYDAGTLGNHEFDNGIDSLASLLKKANYDIISSNYDVSGTPLEGIIKPYIIKEIGGLKIGILALTVDPENLISKKNYDGIKFIDPIESANCTASKLKKEGADIIVALSHLGYVPEEGSGRVKDPDIAANSTDIDIIIGGHSHTVINPDDPDNPYPYKVANKNGKEVIISQTGKSGAYVGCITIPFTKE